MDARSAPQRILHTNPVNKQFTVDLGPTAEIPGLPAPTSHLGVNRMYFVQPRDGISSRTAGLALQLLFLFEMSAASLSVTTPSPLWTLMIGGSMPR